MKIRNLPGIAKLAVPVFFSMLPIHAVEAVEAVEADEYGQFPDRTMIQLGALFIADSNTSISANGSNAGIGTTLDFERDLDGETSFTTTSLDFFYRFNDRHRIEFAAFQLRRDGNQVIDRSISFRDRTFSTSTQIDSEINNDVYKLGYAYSFYHVDKVELAVSVGLNVLDYEVKLSSSAGGFAEAAAITAPMPVFGLLMDYSVTPRLSVRFRTDSFYFDFEDKVRGSLLELQAGLEYRVLNNFALGASVSRLAIDVELSDEKFDGSVEDLYRGARIYGSLYF